MTTQTRDQTAELIGAYYQNLAARLASYDAAGLRALLAPDIPTKARSRPFLRASMRSCLASKCSSNASPRCTWSKHIYLDDEAGHAVRTATCCRSGTRPFAEFFEVRTGRIQTIRLVFDTVGQAPAAALT